MRPPRGRRLLRWLVGLMAFWGEGQVLALQVLLAALTVIVLLEAILLVTRAT